MAKVSREAAEVRARIVYWGAAGSGKSIGVDGVLSGYRVPLMYGG